MKPEKKEVLIVGAGPVGLTMACELRKHHIPCRIIDKAATRLQVSKAIAVHSRTLEVFRGMNMVKAVLEAGHQVGSARIMDGKKAIAVYDFASLKMPYPYFLSIPQHVVESKIEARLGELGVQVERNITLLEIEEHQDGAWALLQHADGREEKVYSPWLIGCDGSYSSVRQLLNIPFEGSSYQRGFIVADAKVAWEKLGDSTQYFIRDKGFIITIPLPNGLHRITLDINEVLNQRKNWTPTYEEIRQLLDEYGFKELKINELVWASKANVHYKIAPSFRQGKVFLAGDAAHIHSPVGGQGMNAGVQDAFNLAWKLAYTYHGWTQPSLLDSYNIERREVINEVMKNTHRNYRLLTLQSPLLKFFRRTLYAYVMSLSKVKQQLVLMIAGLKVNYRKSPWVFGEKSKSLLFAGDRAPDEEVVMCGNGKRQRLFDLFYQNKHSLLLFPGKLSAAEETAKFNELAAFVHKNYAAQIHINMITKDSLPDFHGIKGITLLHDNSKLAYKAYKANDQALYLIRPDGYIAFCSDTLEGGEFKAYLDRIFIKKTIHIPLLEKATESPQSLRV